MGMLVIARKGTMTTILEEKRAAAGLSKKELTERAGLSLTIVCQAEYGRLVSLRSAMRLTVALLGELGPASDPAMLFAPGRERKPAPARGINPNCATRKHAAEWAQLQALYEYRCVYCGRQTTALAQDHVIPRRRGGDAWSNIVSACKACNSRKKDRTPSEAGMVFVIPLRHTVTWAATCPQDGM